MKRSRGNEPADGNPIRERTVSSQTSSWAGSPRRPRSTPPAAASHSRMTLPVNPMGAATLRRAQIRWPRRYERVWTLEGAVGTNAASGSTRSTASYFEGASVGTGRIRMAEKCSCKGNVALRSVRVPAHVSTRVSASSTAGLRTLGSARCFGVLIGAERSGEVVAGGARSAAGVLAARARRSAPPPSDPRTVARSLLQAADVLGVPPQRLPVLDYEYDASTYRDYRASKSCIATSAAGDKLVRRPVPSRFFRRHRKALSPRVPSTAAGLLYVAEHDARAQRGASDLEQQAGCTVYIGDDPRAYPVSGAETARSRRVV